MSHDTRPLPPGWIQQWNDQHNAPFWVDTNANPPRSIWTHPLDDPEYQRSQGSSQAFSPPPGPPPGHSSSSYNNSTSSFPNDSKSPSAFGGHQAASSPAPPATSSQNPPQTGQPSLERTSSKKSGGGLFGKIKAKIDEHKQNRPQQAYGGQGGGYGGYQHGHGGGYGQPQYMQGGYPQQYMQPQGRFGGGGFGGRPGGGGMGAGAGMAMGLGGGLLGGMLISDAINDGQQDAYQEGYEDGGGDFDGADAAMAKRAAPSPAENLARRSGATRMDKRHHGDAAAHADMVKRALAGDYGQVDKRDLPLFQGLLSLLNQVYPGLNTAVFGVEHAANGAVNGLDGILKRNNIELSENQKRELPLFQGLLSTLNQLYPGLNTAVFGVESAANGAVNGLDGILKRDATAAPVNEKRELPLFPGLLSLLNQLYPGLNTAVYGVESAANGAVNGLDGILKKRELPLFPGLLSLLNQLYPGLNTAVFGTEVTLNGAVNGLDGILKKRDNGEELNEVEKRELPLFQGLLSLLNQVYPGLNTAVFGVEHAANGAVNGLDGILKRDTATVKAKVDLAPVVANLLGGSTTVTDLSGTQLSQLRGLAALLNVNQFNSYLGTALSTTQFGTLQSLLGVTVNRLLGGLLSGALLSPSSGLPINGLLGGATGGNLLGGLLGGLGKQ